MLVFDHVRKRGRGRRVRQERTDRFALVEGEGSDVDEAHDVRRVRAGRDDLASVRVCGDDGRAVLELEDLAQPSDIGVQRALRELWRSDVEAVGLTGLDWRVTNA